MIATKGSRNVSHISADGSVLPPFFVRKGVRISNDFRQAVPEDYGF